MELKPKEIHTLLAPDESRRIKCSAKIVILLLYIILV